MKTIRLLTALFSLSLVTGCMELPPEPKNNKEKQQAFFYKCLESVKDNPLSTHYSDQSEVVRECGRQAYYLSLEE